jgi:hypothetical protein
MLLSLGGHCYEIVKTHLQHVFIAAALNLVRIGTWLMERPRAQTRTSRFARLARREDVPAIA